MMMVSATSSALAQCDAWFAAFENVCTQLASCLPEFGCDVATCVDGPAAACFEGYCAARPAPAECGARSTLNNYRNRLAPAKL